MDMLDLLITNNCDKWILSKSLSSSSFKPSCYPACLFYSVSRHPSVLFVMYNSKYQEGDSIFGLCHLVFSIKAAYFQWEE